MNQPLYVRAFTPQERRAVEAGLRSPDAFTLRRSQILLASAAGKRASEIGRDLHVDTDTALNAIRAFNERGLASLSRRSSRPKQVHFALKRALLLIWDNAGWHLSHEVRGWIRAHNWSVRQKGQGVRIVVCFLPSKSSWLNPIEPKWMHGKRAVAEPNRLITPEELERRVCVHFDCEIEPHLTVVEKAA